MPMTPEQAIDMTRIQLKLQDIPVQYRYIVSPYTVSRPFGIELTPHDWDAFITHLMSYDGLRALEIAYDTLQRQTPSHENQRIDAWRVFVWDRCFNGLPTHARKLAYKWLRSADNAHARTANLVKFLKSARVTAEAIRTNTSQAFHPGNLSRAAVFMQNQYKAAYARAQSQTARRASAVNSLESAGKPVPDELREPWTVNTLWPVWEGEAPVPRMPVPEKGSARSRSVVEDPEPARVRVPHPSLPPGTPAWVPPMPGDDDD